MTAFGLAPKQRQALGCIDGLIRAKGYSPSYREISKAMSIGLNQTSEIIGSLVERGYLQRIAGKSRSLALTDAARAIMAEAA